MEPVPLLTVSFLSRVSLGNRWTTRDSTVMSKCTYIWSILDKMFIYSTVLNRREYIYDQNTFSDWYNSDEFIWKFLITKIEYLSNTRSIVARYGKQTEHLIIRFSGYLLTNGGTAACPSAFRLFLLTETGEEKQADDVISEPRWNFPWLWAFDKRSPVIGFVL